MILQNLSPSDFSIYSDAFNQNTTSIDFTDLSPILSSLLGVGVSYSNMGFTQRHILESYMFRDKAQISLI